jgi:hypothetical protein
MKFESFAKNVVLFCHITSRVSTDPDQDLLEEKGGEGFPYIVFMDADGNVLSKHEGGRTVDAFEKSRQDVDIYYKAKSAAAKGDKAAEADVVLSEIDFGILTKEAGEAKLKGLKLKPEQEKRRAQVFYNAEVKDLVSGAALGKRFYDDLKAGKKPTKDDLLGPYYQNIMTYGEQAKKADVFEAGFKGLRAFYESNYGADNPQVRNWVQAQEAALEKLRGK